VKFDLFLILSSMLDIALKQVATVSEVLHLGSRCVHTSHGLFSHGLELDTWCILLRTQILLALSSGKGTVEVHI